MVRAPASFASCSANKETPPVPISSTASPGLRPPSCSAVQAVSAATGKVAASTSDKDGGAATASSAGTATYSASTPGNGPPSVLRDRCSGVGFPSCQPC